MRLTPTAFFSSLRNLESSSMQPVTLAPVKNYMHLFTRAPQAQVTMYRVQPLQSRYEVFSTLQFDISQKSAARIYDLAKFYLKPDAEEEELLLKLLLSNARLDACEFKRTDDDVSYGFRFHGETNFVKRRLDASEKQKIQKTFSYSEEPSFLNITTSFKLDEHQKSVYARSSLSQWDQLLSEAFINCSSINWLCFSKLQTGFLKTLSKNQALENR
jgi:hypothetical protein